jgi:hypothetical protein
MNIKHFSVSAVIVTILCCGANLRAATSSTAQAAKSDAVQNQLQFVVFGDTKEAAMMHRAYRILATGDHDYKGHRAKAMHAVEDAAKLLGLDLSGDAKDHEKQFLSDDKMREAQGLLRNVLGAAEVKNQERISKHINEAIEEIRAALDVR